jgi:hypothetical protein
VRQNVFTVTPCHEKCLSPVKAHSTFSQIRESLSGESDWLAHCPRLGFWDSYLVWGEGSSFCLNFTIWSNFLSHAFCIMCQEMLTNNQHQHSLHCKMQNGKSAVTLVCIGVFLCIFMSQAFSKSIVTESEACRTVD